MYPCVCKSLGDAGVDVVNGLCSANVADVPFAGAASVDAAAPLVAAAVDAAAVVAAQLKLLVLPFELLPAGGGVRVISDSFPGPSREITKLDFEIINRIALEFRMLTIRKFTISMSSSHLE